MSERINEANELSSKGYNCAQSVIGAFCEKYNIDKETAMKFAGGFGGGLRCGEVCGAVTGAVMVIGLKYGQYLLDDLESKEKCGEITLKFMEDYKKRNNSILCKELLGYDPRDKETAEKQKDKKKAICSNAIELAINMLVEMEI